MTEDQARDAGYDDFLDAVATEGGYYLRCPNGHGWLPPREICPDCRSRELTETPLPEVGTVQVTSTVHVAAPQFTDDVPYTVVLAEFGDVTLTGQLRAAAADDIARGDRVTPTVVESTTTGDRFLAFEPA